MPRLTHGAGIRVAFAGLLLCLTTSPAHAKIDKNAARAAAVDGDGDAGPSSGRAGAASKLLNVTCRHYKVLREYGNNLEYGFCEPPASGGTAFYLPVIDSFHTGETLRLAVVPARPNAFPHPVDQQRHPAYSVHEVLERSGPPPGSALLGSEQHRARKLTGGVPRSHDTLITDPHWPPQNISIITIVINYNDYRADTCDEACWAAQTFGDTQSVRAIFRESSYGLINLDPTISNYLFIEMNRDAADGLDAGTWASSCPHQVR